MPDETPTIFITVQTPPIQDEPAVKMVVASPTGPQGQAITPICLTMAAYLALTVEEQMDPTKLYLIPQTF